LGDMGRVSPQGDSKSDSGALAGRHQAGLKRRAEAMCCE
jgi:hypothetical protein